MASGVETTIPVCLVATCQYGDPNKLCEDITKSKVPVDENAGETPPDIDWSFETKYYTCSIKLRRRTIRNTEPNESIEAVVFVFTPDEHNSWSSVHSWWSDFEALDPPVRLLVCETCNETSSIPRTTIQQWCIDNEFELVELNPTTSDEEDEFDTDGIRRIMQVLHAHTWPNLVMKETPDTLSPYMKQLMEDMKAEESKSAVNSADYAQGDVSVDLQAELGMSPDEIADALHDSGENGVASFETLFSKLHLMKEKATCLPPEERKAYAEKIALSFWHAIGGSDEESD